MAQIKTIQVVGQSLITLAALIVGIIALVVFFDLLQSIGLVSAVILGVLGLLFVAVVGYFNPNTLHSHATLLIGVVVFLMALGFVSDHLSVFNSVAPSNWIGQTVGASKMDLAGNITSIVMTPAAFAGIILAIAALLLVLTATRRKRRR